MAPTAADVLIEAIQNRGQEALEECDTLLIVGSSFPYIEFLPKPGQARGVQIELDLRRKTEREFLESAQEADEGLARAGLSASSYARRST